MAVGDRKPRYDWIDLLQIGDVVRFPSGRLRTVVGLGRVSGRLGRVTHVEFPILCCSWTKRGTTVINRFEVVARGGRPTIARVNLQRPGLGRRLAKGEPVTCCEVIGVFE